MATLKLPTHLGNVNVPANSSIDYDIDATSTNSTVYPFITMEFILLKPYPLDVSCKLNDKIIYENKIDQRFNSHYYDIKTGDNPGPFKITIANSNNVDVPLRLSFRGH